MRAPARRVLRVPFLALAMALLLAGCVDSIRGFGDRLKAEPEPPEDYVVTFSEFVAPQASLEHLFTVDKASAEVRADVTLRVESPSPVDLPVVPAQITISFRAPDGAPVGESATLDPRAPTATIYARDLNATGDYALVVEGMGLSGNGGGAAYNGTLRVTYLPSAKEG